MFKPGLEYKITLWICGLFYSKKMVIILALIFWYTYTVPNLKSSWTYPGLRGVYTRLKSSDEGNDGRSAEQQELVNKAVRAKVDLLKSII